MLLSDLYRHQEWADAMHWKAIESIPALLHDHELQQCLYHIHLTQYGYRCIISGDTFVYKPFEEFREVNLLKKFAVENHKRLVALVSDIDPAKLMESVTIPWFKNPPLTISLENALVQATLHSHYHRGQNAHRIRTLGGQPPLIDFIAWISANRPPAAWS